jgi:hypothetical protein
MLSVDGLNMLPNRKTRTRIAVVGTDTDGNKYYYRSVGALSSEIGVQPSKIKTMAITKMPLNGITYELVPASTIEEYLPKQLRRHTKERERGTQVQTSIPPDHYSKLMAISVKTGISRTNLLRAAIENFLEQYED